MLDAELKFKNNIIDNETNKDYSFGAYSQSKRCYQCGEVGHYKAQCPKINRRNNLQRRGRPAKINRYQGERQNFKGYDKHKNLTKC